MIRADISPISVREQLARAGRVQVRDFLEPGAADRLHQCLSREVRWSLAVCDEGGMRTLEREEYERLDDEARQTLYRRLAAEAAGGEYRFAYDSYMMPRAYLEKRDPGLLLHPLLEFLNSPEYLRFMHALTGDSRIRRINAQATAYRPGQFLRTHNDEHSGEGRLFAYVLNLTRRWRADWGGLLHFVDEDDAVTGTFMPHWNSLTLFKVPVKHTVSMVMPWAEEARFAITGWMLATERPTQAETGL